MNNIIKSNAPLILPDFSELEDANIIVPLMFKHLTVILADVGMSMKDPNTIYSEISKFETIILAIKQLISRLTKHRYAKQHELALIVFATSAKTIVSASDIIADNNQQIDIGLNTYKDIEKIKNFDLDSSSFCSGLIETQQVIEGFFSSTAILEVPVSASVIILSDGKTNDEIDDINRIGRELKENKKVKIYCSHYGQASEASKMLLQDLVSDVDNCYTTVNDSNSIYEFILKSISDEIRIKLK